MDKTTLGSSAIRALFFIILIYITLAHRLFSWNQVVCSVTDLVLKH